MEFGSTLTEGQYVKRKHTKMKNEFFDTGIEPLDQAKIKAQHALQELPVLSVRSVISLGFALWFILSIGITIA